MKYFIIMLLMVSCGRESFTEKETDFARCYCQNQGGPLSLSKNIFKDLFIKCQNGESEMFLASHLYFCDLKEN